MEIIVISVIMTLFTAVLVFLTGRIVVSSIEAKEKQKHTTASIVGFEHIYYKRFNGLVPTVEFVNDCGEKIISKCGIIKNEIHKGFDIGSTVNIVYRMDRKALNNKQIIDVTITDKKLRPVSTKTSMIAPIILSMIFLILTFLLWGIVIYP